jgi:hypothetical protein
MSWFQQIALLDAIAPTSNFIRRNTLDHKGHGQCSNTNKFLIRGHISGRDTGSIMFGTMIETITPFQTLFA